MVKSSPATVLITGTSRGLGRALAQELARRRGFRVIATAREGAEAFARELGADHRGTSLDVSDAASIAALATWLGDAGLALDHLVNNAGVAFGRLDPTIARRVIDVNYLGVRDVTQALLPRMAPGGVITMVSSGMGELDVYPPELRDRFLAEDLTRAQLDALVADFVARVANGTFAAAGWPASAYRVSKAALNALTRILARDLAPALRVNAVCPGWVKTQLGGHHAPRELPEGVASIVATMLMPSGSGGFYRDGRAIAW